MLINSNNLSALYTGFQTAFQMGFGEAPSDHEFFVMETMSTTAEEEYPFLGEDDDVREWLGERVVQGIREHGYKILNKDYERTVSVLRNHIQDDRYGTYTPRFERMGRAAGRHICKTSFATLVDGFSEECFDGQSFFDTDHPVGGGGSVQSNSGGGNGNPWFLIDANQMIKPVVCQKRQDFQFTNLDDPTDENVFMRKEYVYGIDSRLGFGYGLWQTAYGSKQALTKARYSAAYQAMLEFKNDAGSPIGTMPTHLLVGPSNRSEALQILNAMFDAAGASNVEHQTATLIVTPWLK